MFANSNDVLGIAFATQLAVGYKQLCEFINATGSPSIYNDLKDCCANLATATLGLSELYEIAGASAFREAAEADDAMISEFAMDDDEAAVDEV